MALVEAHTAFVLHHDWGGWGSSSKLRYLKGKLKEENTYIFIFSLTQKDMYNKFCEGIAEEGWDVIYSKVAMNTVHPGQNRIFMVIIEKKDE